MNYIRVKKNQKFNPGSIVNVGNCLDCKEPKKFGNDCIHCDNYLATMEKIDMPVGMFLREYGHLVTKDGRLLCTEESWSVMQNAFVFNFKSYNLYARFRSGALFIHSFNKRTEEIKDLSYVDFNQEPYAKWECYDYNGRINPNAERLAKKISGKMLEIQRYYLKTKGK